MSSLCVRQFIVLCGLLLCLPEVHAKAYVLIVGGLGGNTDYAESFAATVDAMENNFTPGSQWLGGETELAVLSGADARKLAIEQQLAQFAQNATADDSLVLMLIGHGSYDGEHYRFNIPGPDLHDTDLKQALKKFRSDNQLVVLGTSASGVMLQQLDKPGRIVITATKSGGEINAVAFAKYWATALTTDKADSDRNEIVTVDEAFRYTRNAVEAHYSEQNLLASEHARIIGDDAERQAVALIGSLQHAGNDPQVGKLLERRAKLEKEFVVLRDTKPERDADDYYSALQEIMLRMARLQVQIDEQTGWLQSE